MENIRGIALMVTAMGLFAVEDALIKIAARDVPVWQILVILGAFGMAVFAAEARRRGIAAWSRSFLHPAVLVRNAAEVTGTLAFVTALALIPLSTATTILQAAPLVVTAGAALVLAETVGWRRWLAVAFGFLGVLLVVKPGMAGFDVEALWAVAAVLGLSVRDLATRRIPKDIHTIQLAVWAYAAILALGCGFVVFGARPVMPGREAALALAAAAMIGIFAYWSLTEALRAGEVSAIAPFRYSRLVFGVGIGVVVFGETLDTPTLAGAAIILGAGLYAFWRESRRGRRAGTPSAAR